jgi:hypothetical protein
MKLRVIASIVLLLGLLALIGTRRQRAGTRPGSNERVATHVSVPAETPKSADLRPRAGVSLASNFPGPIVSKFAPLDSDDRSTKQDKRIEVALIQKFLETAPVDAGDMGRLLELLLRRSYAQSSSERESVDAELRRLVGDEYYREIETSSHRTNVPLYAIEFIGEALWRGHPLMPEQREALTRAIRRLDAAGAKVQRAPAARADGLTDYDHEVRNAVRDILTPEQVQILEQVRREIAAEEERRSGFLARDSKSWRLCCPLL